jgi:exodeoxyribonuclease VII large subunit
VRDVLKVLRRRFPAIPVVIYPVQVQGEPAKTDIVRALRVAAERAECDVLILTRGGGSLEDLWAFNEEIVARAIYDCPLPVVSAIGHEIDFTIADLVADLRAPTPSGAAEMVAPDARDWSRHVAGLERNAALGALRGVERIRSRAAALDQRLLRTHPGYILRQRSQRLDELLARLVGAVRRALGLRRLQAVHATTRLRSATPRAQFRRSELELARQRLRLAGAMRTQLATTGGRLAVAVAALQAFSPLSTLERGYAIVTDPATGTVVRKARDLEIDQAITGRLAEGEFDAVVRKIRLS